VAQANEEGDSQMSEVDSPMQRNRKTAECQANAKKRQANEEKPGQCKETEDSQMPEGDSQMSEDTPSKDITKKVKAIHMDDDDCVTLGPLNKKPRICDGFEKAFQEPEEFEKRMRAEVPGSTQMEIGPNI